MTTSHTTTPVPPCTLRLLLRNLSRAKPLFSSFPRRGSKRSSSCMYVAGGGVREQNTPAKSLLGSMTAVRGTVPAQGPEA